MSIICDIIIQIVILESFSTDTGLRRLHHIDIYLIEGRHIDIARIRVLHFEIADATAHIPHDILLLPVDTECLCELIISLIYDMEGCIVGSLEAPLIEGDE